MKDKEYILCASIWYKELPLVRPELLEPRGFRPYNVDRGIVISGWRHVNCLYQMASITGLRDIPEQVGDSTQGFLTNKNRFVGREEGAQIAFDAGQIKQHVISLYSEDLY